MNSQIDMEVIEEIIRVSEAMEDVNLVNTYEGNLSIKKGDLIYITPTRTRKSSLTPEQIAIIDSEGNQISGTKKPSSETVMHCAAYEYRDDVSAVIHCHAPYLTAHAMCNKSIKVFCHPELLLFFKDIPCAPYGRPGTRQIIDNGADMLKTHNLILLGNHGVLAVGSTLEKAFSRVESAEKFARILTICKSVGDTVDIPAEEIEMLLQVKVDV